MLTLCPTIRIYLCNRPVDLRCGMDRLACLARERVEEDPLSGHLFVFRNRRSNRLKVLYWDRNGWALWCKRLERGRFGFPDSGGGESRTLSTSSANGNSSATRRENRDATLSMRRGPSGANSPPRSSAPKRERLFEQRRELRREKSAPVIETLRVWMNDRFDVLPRSALGEAIGYVQNQWPALMRFLEDGRVELDNNAAERAVRPIAVGRKNWLFAGSERGGRAAATFFTLIESARRNGVNPYIYLRDVLERLPSHPINRIDDLLPDRWKASPTTGSPIIGPPTT